MQTSTKEIKKKILCNSINLIHRNIYDSLPLLSLTLCLWVSVNPHSSSPNCIINWAMIIAISTSTPSSICPLSFLNNIICLYMNICIYSCPATGLYLLLFLLIGGDLFSQILVRLPICHTVPGYNSWQYWRF